VPFRLVNREYPKGTPLHIKREIVVNDRFRRDIPAGLARRGTRPRPAPGTSPIGVGFIPARVAFLNHATSKTTLHCLFIGAGGNKSRPYDRGSDPAFRLNPCDVEIFHRLVPLEPYDAKIFHRLVPLEPPDAKNFHRPVPLESTDSKIFHHPVPLESTDVKIFHRPVPLEPPDAKIFHRLVPLEPTDAKIFHRLVPF
jgi:hypothetical protein